jgi:ligand-binding sensor protein
MLLPVCVRLLLTGIPSYIALAALGFVFSGVMLFSHENNYKLIRRSVGLALSNKELLDEVSLLAAKLQYENDTLEARWPREARICCGWPITTS